MKPKAVYTLTPTAVATEAEMAATGSGLIAPHRMICN